MKKTILFFTLLLIMLGALFITGCTAAMNERIQEGTRIAPLDEAVHAVDRSVELAVRRNIMSDITLEYYARQYGENFVIEASHNVVTVSMKVKTEEQRDRALELAARVARVTEVIDNIEVDPTIEDTPFAEIWD